MFYIDDLPSFFMVIDKFSLIYDLNVYACVSSISASFVLRINYIFVHILCNFLTGNKFEFFNVSMWKPILTTGSNIFSPNVLFCMIYHL